MRNAFASAIQGLARKNEDVLLLYGDIGNKLFDGYKEEFPQRAINSGVAEANMVSVAAGLAKEGFKPFAYTINSFLYLKALEQIKLDVCYTNLPVTLVGTGAALSYSALGTSHHSLEDIGVLRNLPNLQIFSPSDPNELSHLVGFIHENSHPSYIRLGKKGEKNLPVYEVISSSKAYYGIQRRTEYFSDEGVILCHGTINENVASAVKKLEEKGLRLEHYSLPQIKPIDMSSLSSILAKHRNLVVVEEHNSIGGLTEIVASNYMAKNSMNFLALNAGMRFHTGLGEIEHARKQLGLSGDLIATAIYDFFRSK
jgi:transketolase